MTADEVVQQLKENASEWLEMTEDPTALLVGILANKIVSLYDQVEYLEKRLKTVR